MPGLHCVGASAPVLQKEPASHAVHCPLLSSPGVLEYEPSKHGSGADAPSAQNEPGVQPKHAVAPLAFMKEPPAHLSHEPCSADGCTVPGLHSAAASEPVEQNEPASHGVHWSALARPSVLLYEPSKHGKGADEPSAQNEPAMHVLHAVPPAPSW